MKPVYIQDPDGKVLAVDSNVVGAKISVRTDATVEFTVEAPADSVAPNSYRTPVNPNPPTWLAAPAAVNGVIVFDFPIAALRFEGGTVATVLQQGLR